MKIDLVMWTLNSQRTLDPTLSSVSNAIDEKHICHRIIVDGGSTDSTESIARKHGWQFLRGRRGISSQANYALELVDTPLYASFEHDIVLNPTWLPRMLAQLERDPKTAVSQGIRLTKGSKSLEALDRFAYERGMLIGSAGFYSIDNNLCKTEIIRKIGGYPYGDAVSIDGLLRQRLLANGYKWFVDVRCVSRHLQSGYWRTLGHWTKLTVQTRHLGYSSAGPFSSQLARIAFSPFRGAQIAAKYHAFWTLACYPILRYQKLITLGLLSRTKEIIGSTGNGSELQPPPHVPKSSLQTRRISEIHADSFTNSF